MRTIETITQPIATIAKFDLALSSVCLKHRFNQQVANLVGAKSFEEMMKRVLNFQNKHNNDFILGRGWDQNDWGNTDWPNNELLNELFPQ